MQKMIYNVTCEHCKTQYSFEVPTGQFFRWVRGDGLIQDLLPELTDGQRELMISRTCDKCWNEIFETQKDSDKDA